MPDSGYREKSRDDIIALAKQYRWHVVGATSAFGLIVLFALSSSQHMAPNSDFIALQNPQVNEYELEYMLDEVAEEASIGNFDARSYTVTLLSSPPTARYFESGENETE